jgi:P-type Ca2+ transporter type 2C
MTGFTIDKDRLNKVNEEKDVPGWKQLGGTLDVAAQLQTDLKTGLTKEGVERNRAEFGPNSFKQVPPKSFLSILFAALRDPTLILLMFAAAISTTLGAAIKAEREEKAWIEGVAIWFAVIIVSMVGSVNDYQKELQFRKLNSQKDAISIKVIREGKEQLVPNTDVVVGDLMVLDTGDKVVADGVEIEGHGLTIDEASLTGESDPIKKLPDGDFWCRAGSQVSTMVFGSLLGRVFFGNLLQSNMSRMFHVFATRYPNIRGTKVKCSVKFTLQAGSQMLVLEISTMGVHSGHGRRCPRARNCCGTQL